ncbi:DUF1508 domain-containing protein [Lentzea sp. NBC_00516]|uniref:DUF1508 domain-containing protein n=1 Tax=Lentzea sp. NBC_00516 TaxID=2903582 RepID=UPI002E823D3C|nr:DUF1508 domain-containing protein [Lentzea sp. NBC_00516]WUD23173.1 DUF1508 domain-containing protein [Lentzea sp. NBC_00516]
MRGESPPGRKRFQIGELLKDAPEYRRSFLLLALVQSTLAAIVAAVALTFLNWQRFSGYSFFIGIIIGSVASLLLFVYQYRLRARRSRNVYLQYQFMDTFGSIERKIREIASISLASDSEVARLSALADALSENKIIAADEVNDFFELLSLRNEVAHPSGRPPKADQLESALKRAYTLLGRLDSAIADLSAKAENVGPSEYESRLAAAIRSLSNGLAVKRLVDDDVFDFSVRTASGRISVALKYRKPPRRLGMNDVLRIVDQSSSVSSAGRLIVTNSDLTEEIRAFNARSDRFTPPVEVIQWRDANDNDLLQRALARLARKQDQDLQGSSVRVTKNSAGKYYFTIHAPNGAILAQSALYGSREELLGALNETRRIASSNHNDER